jgi:MtN3 and saliva related transmembrane protein
LPPQANSCRMATHAAVFSLAVIALCGCQELVPHDTQSLFAPTLRRSEIIGFLAGLGTTFAAGPDLITMFKRRSSAGMNPRMAAIIGVFQILWVYYGLLIASRPVIVWNVIAVLINFLCVGAYGYFVRTEGSKQNSR